MKDARFKELLNLHLDHRLSPADAEELEAAVNADPARHKALRDYEAMQSACAALFSRSETRAPSSTALLRSLRQAEARIEHPRNFQDGWRWQTWGLTGGLAACVALVVARLSQPALTAAKPPESPDAEAPKAAVVLADSSVPAKAFVDVARRPAAPGNLAFAALGLSPHGANADAASRWILQAEDPAMFSTLKEASAAGAAMAAWSEALPVGGSGQQFTSRAITDWSPANANSQGFQVDTVSLRFER
jgi:hypothetical protein